MKLTKVGDNLLDLDEIIAAKYYKSSTHENLIVYLRGGGELKLGGGINTEYAVPVINLWKHLSKDIPELERQE